ncbi:MAG TPA: hypothetical protein VNT52_12660, partial [Acidimicrobiales bacterium]|nr:hypothetical protein [Acidimicrobiales bacterium]
MPAERRIAVLLVLSTLAALGLAAGDIDGGQPQLEGALLGIALTGIGVALILWARGLSTEGAVIAERRPGSSVTSSMRSSTASSSSSTPPRGP